jgi:hypothetical protein
MNLNVLIYRIIILTLHELRVFLETFKRQRL